MANKDEKWRIVAHLRNKGNLNNTLIEVPQLKPFEFRGTASKSL